VEIFARYIWDATLKYARGFKGLKHFLAQTRRVAEFPSTK
jgi:hypothetical protein